MSNRYGERRGLYSALWHLSIISLGWLWGRWMGLIFFSMPLILVYYATLYWFAMVIIPANDPDSKLILFDKKNETWQRFVIFIWYTWGMQYPMNAVSDEWGREIPPTRISGSPFRKAGEPGIIFTHAHQVVGITAGTDFSRVDGPGTVFTKRFERPLEIVDLRRQVRISKIEAFTKDGIRFNPRLFMVFKVNDSSPDHTNGSFPYSKKWVRRLLKLTGVMQTQPNKKTPIRWDEMVVKQIEQTAQQTLSKRTLDELWKPQDSAKFDSAFVEIREQIKSALQQRLEEEGITIFTVAMPGFKFPEEKDNSIPNQQLKTWQASWERQANQTIAEGDAEAIRLQEEARAYAQSILLKALAEGIKQTKPKISRYVIAVRFIGAIQELMKRQPEIAEKVGTEINSQLENIKQGISPQ
jgi:regulator of protease activity HflC (stomatin/prohibitin superfamily)